MVLIMGMALLIFTPGERQLHLALKQNNETIPNKKGKPTQTPTMRWVFLTFEGLDILSVWADGQLINHQILNQRPVHPQIIRLLGTHVQICYFFRPVEVRNVGNMVA